MNLRSRIAALMMLALMAGSAHAQSYPSRPIRIVVPFPAGGSVDTVGRWVGQKLSDAWKQPVLIDNRAGAGGNVGADAVAKSPPDGYTFLITTPDLAISELIALAKAQPGKLNYGSSGSGATIHLATELFRITTGTDFVHVPYKGEAPAYAALLANEVHGSLRALGVSSIARSGAMPEVPIIAEAGVPRSLPGCRLRSCLCRTSASAFRPWATSLWAAPPGSSPQSTKRT